MRPGRAKPIIGQAQVTQMRVRLQQGGRQRFDALGRHVIVTQVEVGEGDTLAQRGQQQCEMGRVKGAPTKRDRGNGGRLSTSEDRQLESCPSGADTCENTCCWSLAISSERLSCAIGWSRHSNRAGSRLSCADISMCEHSAFHVQCDLLPRRRGSCSCQTAAVAFGDFFRTMASPAAHALWLEGKALFKANQLSEATDKFAQALQAVVGDDTEAEPSADAAPYVDSDFRRLP
jgi:hypothetical protein